VTIVSLFIVHRSPFSVARLADLFSILLTRPFYLAEPPC